MRGWIGVEPRDLTPEIAETFNLPVKQGVLITGVLQDGPASEGGMRPGDVVVESRPTSRSPTPRSCSTRWPRSSPQSQAVIGMQRGDKALQLKVTVAQRPRPQRREPQ